jgi:hypothetical protein
VLTSLSDADDRYKSIARAEAYPVSPSTAEAEDVFHLPVLAPATFVDEVFSTITNRKMIFYNT